MTITIKAGNEKDESQFKRLLSSYLKGKINEIFR
jgi:hypothetical protein